MVYEAMLLFAVVFVAGLIFDIWTQSRHALTLRHARELWLFLVIGAYFVFFWSRSGQTLAMKTWSIRVVDIDQAKLPVVKAVVRYCLAWLWFLPGLALAYQFELKSWSSIVVVCLGMASWALTAVFDKDKQFLHDRLAKTRLINVKQITTDTE
jgi:uncharacterized RDD family membrane protein YckC